MINIFISSFIGSIIVISNAYIFNFFIFKKKINQFNIYKDTILGFIFIGLINVDGQPKVIEYNVRMGDPETQVVLPRIKNDFMDLLISCSNQNLDKIDLKIDSNYYTNVVLASGGYPEEYKKGFEILGLNEVEHSTIFHAGTKLLDNKKFSEKILDSIYKKECAVTSLFFSPFLSYFINSRVQ